MAGRPQFQSTPWTKGGPHIPSGQQQQAPPFSLPISSARIRGPAMRQPREITSFSYDDNRRLHFDDSSLSYFYLLQDDVTASGGIDLSAGYNVFQKRDDTIDEHLDGLLLTLVHLERTTGKKTTGDIITWRGILTKLLCLPYSKNDGFELNAVWFDRQLFIEENLPYKLATQQRSDQRSELMSYWGYKFEQIATIPKPWNDCSRKEIESRGQKPVSNVAQYCSVVKTGLGDVRMVIAGEVDCVWDYKPDPKDNIDDDPKLFDNPLEHYVELKTNRVIQSDRDASTFENKLFRVWAQSFLLGVPKAIVGFRSDQGYLQTFEEFETQKIPGIVKKSKYSNPYTTWDAVDALAFLAACLQWLKTVIPRAEEDVVWTIRYLPRSDYLTVSRTDMPPFLHPDFVQWRSEKSMK
ncbi:RAI1 like PD-XK nuclease-domain-containing protein [Lipomyces kononenkoae]|uniref:RAI1 like PD-XK nuclease-domain-containing protein n=1 Tax=Lipomyces kononenkoae TaxID=34357 RepID=A0ACC3TA12_LIPKO